MSTESSRFKGTSRHEIMSKIELCALCSKGIRKHNGRWRRHKYKIENGVHYLGGLVVRNIRRDASRNFGCESCYEALKSTPVSGNFRQTKE
jgi:hypothetical protein